MMPSITRRKFLHKILPLLAALPAGLGITLIAAPVQTPPGLLNEANPRVQEVMVVQRAVTPGLMTMDGNAILGTAVGQDERGQIVLLVFVNTGGKNPGEVMRSLPASIKGVAVSGRLTEHFVALAGKPGGSGVSHVSKQTPPIRLGTSGGWGYDLANGYCCGGTLGSLININGEQYILSNYHVFESDIVLGGNNRVKQDGDAVIQPGLIDVNCTLAGAQTVGMLAIRNSLPNSNTDCAI